MFKRNLLQAHASLENVEIYNNTADTSKGRGREMPETGDCQQYDGHGLVITRSRVSVPSLLHSVQLQKIVKKSENQADTVKRTISEPC